LNKKTSFETNSGIELKRIYTEKEMQNIGFDTEKDLGDSGSYPFTRGITQEMYRDKLWVMGQYSGFGSAEEANQRYKYLIEQGQTGFSIALDLPTQLGLDSDYHLAQGEVGKVGVAIDSLQDIEYLFDGIPFESIRQIRTTANAIGPILTALYIAFCEKNNIAPNSISFFIQNDPLKEYIGRGAYIFPPKASVKLTADVLEYCSQNMPNWNPLAVSGYHIRDSGSNAVQELAFTFANAISYIDETLERDVDIDVFASKIFAFLASHIDFIEEVAKFRAARKIWARLLKERYGAQNPDTMKLKILAYTCGGTLTAQQPLNNIARVTIEALAAVLGGVQTIATSSYDEALSIPTQEAVMVALRTQQILAHESGVTNTVDVLGGSYSLEYLTKQIEDQVFELIEEIEQLGGAVSCIGKGYFQKKLSEEAYNFQKSIETGEKLLVGVNSFKSNEENDVAIFTTEYGWEKKQIERTKRLRTSRDNNYVHTTLKQLKDDVLNNVNIIPATVEAVKAYATLGEIVDVLKEVYGEYHDEGII